MSWSRRLSTAPQRAVRHLITPFVLAGTVALAPATAQARGRCRIEGSVLDQNGEQVPAAAITLFAGDEVLARTGSDAEGTFRFGHLPRVPVLVEATSAGSAWATGKVKAFSPEGIALLDLTLHRGGRITGTVLDPDGKPVAHASVATTSEDERVHAASCDADGRFVLDHVPFGECDVIAWAAPHVAARATCKVEGAVTTTIRLQRGPGRTLRFRVLGLTAEQRASAHMELFCVEASPEWLRWTLPADATANRSTEPELWEVADLPPQVVVRSASLVVAHARTIPERLISPRHDDPLDELTFRVEPEPMQTVRGIVCDEHGKPVTGLDLELEADDSHVTGTTTTGADGSFAIELQIEGSSYFALRSASPAWALFMRYTGEPDSGTYAGTYHTVATKDFLHKVTAIPATAVVGRVVGQDGAAVPYARVRLEDFTGGDAATEFLGIPTARVAVCDGQGHYEFQELDGGAPNEFRVVAELRGSRGRSEPFRLRARRLRQVDDVRMAPTASVVGRLLAADGSALSGRAVSLRYARHRESWHPPVATCTTDEAGRFRFAELDGASYCLWTDEPAAHRGEAFDLAAGGRCTRDLVLPAR